MKTTLALSAVAAAIAVFSQAALAQPTAPTTGQTAPGGAGSTMPASKADVKAGARTGALAPAGEGPIASQPSRMSDKTRDERKATTKADKSAGNLRPAGEGVKPAGDMGKDDKADKSAGSNTTRDERKATTRAAVKGKTTQPAGDTPAAAGDSPKK